MNEDNKQIFSININELIDVNRIIIHSTDSFGSQFLQQGQF